MEWLCDLCERDKTGVPDLCRRLELDALLADPVPNNPQKCERFRERLYALRFPALAKHLEALEKAMRAVKLPDNTRLSVESPLEDMLFKLEITFQTREELEEKLKRLLKEPPAVF